LRKCSTDPLFNFCKISENFLEDGIDRVAANPAHEGAVSSLGVWKEHLLSAGQDKKIKVWDVETATEIQQMDGHQNCILISDGNNLFASGGMLPWQHMYAKITHQVKIK
jgi:WD40 repeat protein